MSKVTVDRETTVNRTVRATVRLFDPTLDREPRWQTFEVPYVADMRVLEVLEAIAVDLGQSLAYRWFCGVKKCGHCAVKVNGRALLGCWEPAEPEMTIEPIDQFPVLRDLVVDRAPYEAALHRMNAALDRSAPYPGFPEPLSSVGMDAHAILSGCIECLLCTSVCPAYGPEFVGPAPLVQLAKSGLDPRDRGQRGCSAVDAGIEYCVSCYGCTRACPADIPVFELAIEGLRRQVRNDKVESPPTVRARLFANIHAVAKAGSTFAPVANWLGRLSVVRWLGEKLLGIDRRRPLPAFASLPFDRWFRNRQVRRPGGRQVVLFHDTFMTYFEPEIGVATTEVLEAAGYEVVLADGRTCCGRPMLSKGFIEQARAHAIENVRVLAPWAERGIPIVGCEPSCVLMIRRDYPELVPGEAAQVVSRHTHTLEEFLAARAEAGDLALAFTDTRREVLLHGHCHQKALGGTGPALTTLRLPPNYQVEEIPSNCCGMAGSNGYECEHYERSMQAAELALLPAVRAAGSSADIVAAGISCRQQIAHGTGRRARHPALLLRDALRDGVKAPTPHRTG